MQRREPKEHDIEKNQSSFQNRDFGQKERFFDIHIEKQVKTHRYFCTYIFNIS